MGGHMQVVMVERMVYRSQVGCLDNSEDDSYSLAPGEQIYFR
jgi:hypothetical protein